MKKYLPIINLVLLLSLFCFTLYIWHRFNLSSFSRETEFSKNGTGIEHNIGMDWIIGLINSNFSTVITFVTVLFSMLGIITFVGIREKFRFTIERLEERFKEQRDESIIHINNIKSLEGDLSFEVADKMNDRLKVLYDKNEKSLEDYSSIVELSLIACDNYSKSLMFKSDIHPKFKKSVDNLIKFTLSDASKLISTQNKFELNTMGYDRFLRLKRNIEQVCDLEGNQNLSIIFSILDFPDLD
ncbi:hypothetical protein [Olleya sp. HaHaR_3_96]|uniref:hypothetical protein n=1 Tax=Olleya sp. HaHaR_3_96 TaxID=2745560 RepID=UPI001C4FF7E6|nr:hypothetical protein [Olleya sp. HaHaR_3_96]QXP58686.1 hypothetical protein H0I26_12265 [Olleya sp. HaHaR_3_96]